MTVIEREQESVIGKSIETQETQKVWEPKTFAERAAFLSKVCRKYLLGEITWEEKWYYIQKYGLGRTDEVKDNKTPEVA